MGHKGTIYLRDNAWYRSENVIKMGIASFAKDRSNTYITGEVERGEYILVIEIPLDKMKQLDKYLKNYFKNYNIYKGGGTEFYDRQIIHLIEPYLNLLSIEYKVLTKEEIELMNRCERIRSLKNIQNIKKSFNQFNVKNIIQKIKNHKTNGLVSPNQQQTHVLEKITYFYNLNHIGKISWACGAGL